MIVNEIKTCAVEMAIDERKTIQNCINVVETAINALDKHHCDTFYIGYDSVDRTELFAIIENLQILAGAEEMV